MPLITCPDCSNQVSDRAPACPRCGAPIGAARAEAVAVGAALTTVQETSKRLKAHSIGGVLLFWLGFFVFLFSGGGVPTIVGLAILIAGTCWYAATKMRIWWHHK